MDFIVLDSEFEYRVDKYNLIKSVKKNEKGNPILRSNLIGKINDQKIVDNLNQITETEDVQQLPDIGQPAEEGKLYISEWGLLKCRQTHNRTIYDPIDVPALFSFYREETEETGDLEWIQNEYVYVGWVRVYDGVVYTVIQEHQTQSDWTPDKTPTLWQSTEEPTNEVSEWVQPTGAHDAYNIGDQVLFNGSTYESVINANVWSPSTYPAGWKTVTALKSSRVKGK